MTNTTNTRRKPRLAREPQTKTTSPGAESPAAGAPTSDRPLQPKKPNKTEVVLSLLKRYDGATLDELVEATGWLPHTTRSALTGLKKKGHTIERKKVDGGIRYTVAAN